jgi:hypothetical protein
MKLPLCILVNILNTVYVSSLVLPRDKIFTFWHISDIHFDAFYSVHGDPDNWCHYNYNNSSSNNSSSSLKINNISYEFNLGKYGDFGCESNWNLLTSAFEMMKNHNGEPGTTGRI